ncbi:MAG: S41 family peptidase, partial [Dehalococcoidia bacterium]|nr:S41 family peptidase [Dehalococcoidia bacterium]
RAGDIILEVDGESAEGWSVEEAVLRIRGPIGTTVSLTIRHGDGVVETLALERDAIEVASVSTAPPGGVLRDAGGNTVTDVGYIRISSYTRTTPQELEDAIAAAEAAGVRGLILDVRSNPGGLLQETVEIADMLLDSGDILTQVERDGSERTASAREGMVTALPIVIVQDGFSASGAELMAAALQENGRAQVVGEPSFGKGTVNRAVELSNGGAVYVSIARWLTPARNQIEGRGVIPDVEVTLTVEDIDASRDVPVIRAIELLRATP